LPLPFGSAWLLFVALPAQAQIEIVLKDAFSNKYENRVGITSAAGVAKGALTWNLLYEMIVVRASPLPDDPDEPPCETFE
jgi:hypothetical protein